MCDTRTIHCNHPNDLLSQDELKKIEQRMYAGGYSQTGFLGKSELLLDTLKKDQDFLQSVGITCEQIGDVLTKLVDSYHQICYLVREEQLQINDGILKSSDAKYSNMVLSIHNTRIEMNNYIVSSVIYGGAQICPFKNDGIDNDYHGYDYGNCDITIANKKTSQKITFNTLMPHMIKAHKFFEGSVEHRLDPKIVIDFFEIKPEVSYRPMYKVLEKSKWSLRSTTGWNDKLLIDACRTYACCHRIVNTKGKLNFKAHVFLMHGNNSSYFFGLTNSYKKKMSYDDVRRAFYVEQNEHNIKCNEIIYRSKKEIYTDVEIDLMIKQEKEIMKKYTKEPTIENIGSMCMVMLVVHCDRNEIEEGKFNTNNHRYIIFGTECVDSFYDGMFHMYQFEKYQQRDIVLDQFV